MNALRSALTAGLLMLGAGSQLALADAAKDTEMLKLASTSGCLTCHHIEPGKLPDGRAPVGPAWRDVARPALTSSFRWKDKRPLGSVPSSSAMRTTAKPSSPA